MPFRFNPFTGKLDIVEDLSPYWKTDGSSSPATGNWDLGTNSLSFADGSGFIDWTADGQSLSIEGASAALLLTGKNAVTAVGFTANDAVGNAFFNISALTGDQTFALPDNSGTLALTSGVLNLDQTTPQTVINGTPVFNVGLSAANQIISTLAIGTSPFNVTSNTVNTNLNADLLDGLHVGTSGSAVSDIAADNRWTGAQSFIHDSPQITIGAGTGGTPVAAGLKINDSQTASGAVTLGVDKLSGGAYNATFPDVGTTASKVVMGTVGNGHVAFGVTQGNGTVITSNKSLTYNAAVLQVGSAGTPGAINLQATNGAISYLQGFKGGSVATATYSFTMPTALPGATQLITSTNGGQLGYQTGTANTLAYFSSTNVLGNITAVGSTGQYLRANTGVAPGWSTLTLPNTATAYKLAAYTATNVMTELAAVGATDEILVGNTGAIPSWSSTISNTLKKASGIHRSLSTSYISGTGTAGTDNTAQTVVTVALAANTLTQVGDRLRIRVYWKGDTGAPITGTAKLGAAGSEVTVSDTTDGGGATLQLNEAWVHYIDNTHANIIEQEVGALGAVSAVNVAGFTWNAAQQVIITQDAISGNHIIVYAVIVDILPKGI